MAKSLTTTDLKELLGYPFRDPYWKNKFLLGSLVVLAGFAIPFVPFAVLYGYMMQIMRRIIIEQGEPFLPEWDDWGQLMVDGLKLLGAMMIYIAPIFLVCFGGLILGSMVASLLVETASKSEPTLNLLVGMILLAGGLVVMLLIMLLMLGVGAVLPAVMSHVAATGEFGAAFRWREWWPIYQANLSGFLIAYLMTIALSYGLSFVLSFLYMTIILCCLIPFLTAPITVYTLAIQSALFAQAYRDGAQKLKNKVELV